MAKKKKSERNIELLAEKTHFVTCDSFWTVLFFLCVYKTICESPLNQLSSNNVLSDREKQEGINRTCGHV